MIASLKAPFWFGLPGYAWLAGVVALVGGGAYFLMHRAAPSAATISPLSGVLDNSGVLNPYPSGGGTPVPPGNPINPNGGPPPPYDPSGGIGPRGIPNLGPVAHTPMPPAVQQLSQHEKEWLKLHPNSTMAAVAANDAAWRKAHG